MLRAILLASPVVLVAVISCGDSSATFDDVTGGSAGTSNAIGGASHAGKSSQGGNLAIAGSSSTMGGSGKGGQGSGNGGTANNGGTKNNAGSANNGGTANQAGTTNHAGTANQGGAANQAGTANQGGAGNGGEPNDPGGAANAGAAGADAAGAAGMAGSGSTDPQCPELFGSYKIKNKEGMCSGLNKDAPQTIEGNTDACSAHFVSEPPTGPEGLNGAASIDADGDFDGALLYLDMTQRSPCSGSWNAADETMTITCGGQGDMCTVLLELQ